MRDVGWRAERPASKLLSRWKVASRDLQRLHCSLINQPKMVPSEVYQCGNGLEMNWLFIALTSARLNRSG